MIVRTWMVPCSGQESNVHLIACTRTRAAAIVDAGAFPDEMRHEIERLGLTVTQILITHGHFDHVDALPQILSAWRAPVLASKPLSRDTRVVGDGDEISVGELTGRVVLTSGHTPDSISFIFEDHSENHSENHVVDRVVFTGDALFAGSIGGTASDQCKREEIEHIRSKIFALPDDCEIRPGHGPASTVGIERAANPFFN